MINRIYLDLDGVVSDFTAGWCKCFDIEFSNEREKYPLPIGLWNYTDWIYTNLGIHWDSITEECNYISFWESLPILDAVAAHWLVYYSERIAPVTFLSTATGDYYNNLDGKLLWLGKYGFLNPLIVCKDNNEKNDYANSFSVLIDDNDGNIQNFIEAGGQGIVVPRLWNNRHWEFQSFLQSNELVLDNLRTLL